MNEAKLWFWILIDVMVAFVIVIGVAVVGPAVLRYADSLTPARTITVTAEGKTTATPDIAEISFSVVSQGSDPQALSTNNTAKMNAVMQFLASQNIASSDIATTAYDLEPNYTYHNDTQTNTITGYTLTQTVTVKIRDLSNVAAVLGGVAPLGVNQIGGVNFTFDDNDAILAAARADAFANAKTKADAMASAAGVSLGEVVNVSENGTTPTPIYSGYGVDAMSVGASAPTTPVVQPGSQDITDDVTVTYALR